MKRLTILFIVVISVVAAFAQTDYRQLTNVPTIYIETFNNAQITSKNTYLYARMTYNDGGRITQYDSLQIRGRGNSTWNLAKKPYRIKFKESTKFLGKGYAKNKSWTLLANHADKSLLRNAVTSRMGKFLGQSFNPAAHFVDLVINGTYLGCYQVSDQVNVDNKRVEIFEQEEFPTDTTDISGGYLVEIDGFGTSEPYYFRTNKNIIVSIKSPDEDVISDRQVNYIRNYLNDFESRLFSSNYTDEASGYRALVDSTALVSWYIATELSANVDGFWSTYLYKDRANPKLYFGPLWDYDIAYNNCDRTGDVTERSMVDAAFGDDLAKIWVKRFVKDSWFNNAVNDAWKQALSDGLEEYLYNYIDSMALHIDESQAKNYSIYSIHSHVYNEIYLYSTYSEYISQLKTFIGEHIDFLSTLFAERAGDTSGGGEGGGSEGGGEVLLRPFELNSEYYYRVYNRGVNNVFDLATTADTLSSSVIMWSPEYERRSQLWQVYKVGDYYQFINSVTGQALYDPSPMYTTGTQLTTVNPDVSDNRQLWQLVTVNENGNYNMINVFTNNVINNSGGNSANGNSVISYTNDDRNAVSNNRQWRVVPEELIPDYIPDEVISLLNETISSAETFLGTLTDDRIGEGIFCYNKDNIDALRQKVQDAKQFESTVPDDYILMKVTLAEQLNNAKKVNMPLPDTKYIIKHKVSGFCLHVLPERVEISPLDVDSTSMLYNIIASDDKVYIKTLSQLYLSLGDNNSWTMVGKDNVGDSGNAKFTIEFTGAEYVVHTVSGILGTNYTEEGSKVYADKRNNVDDERQRSLWILEEYIEPTVDSLQQKRDELAVALKYAKECADVDASWLGEKPLQLSAERYKELCDIIAVAQGGDFSTSEQIDDVIMQLNNAADAFCVLNVPSADKDCCLSLSSLQLSVEQGVTLAIADTLDGSQRFRLLAVEENPNCYNIYSNGAYLTLFDEQGTMLALSDTPCDDYGRFTVEQVAADEFVLHTMAGCLGVNWPAPEAGDYCVANANDEGCVRWRLIPVTMAPASGELTVIKPLSIDYMLRYNSDTQIIDFVSSDISMLSAVTARVYTVGGHLLYSFAANEKQTLAGLPSGTYIIRWDYAGNEHSVKLKK